VLFTGDCSGVAYGFAYILSGVLPMLLMLLTAAFVLEARKAKI
jgi:hypothetical protein